MFNPMTRALPAASAITLSALSAVAVLALAPAPANADTDKFTDARGDVAHAADLRSVTVHNTAEDVRVVVTVRDLASDRAVGATVFVDTDGKPGPEYALVAGLTGGADYSMVRTDSWKLSKARKAMTCPHTVRLDNAADTARFRIDKSCFKKVPGDGTVRVEVRTSGTTAAGKTVSDWLDSPHRFGTAIAQD